MKQKPTAPLPELLRLPFTLRGIYLRSASHWMAPDYDPILSAQQPHFPLIRTTQGKLDCRTATIQEGPIERHVRSCVYRITHEFAYTSADANTEEEIERLLVAKVTAELAVDYLVQADEFPEQARLQAWGSRHALAHTWPYWREYCHSTLQRMNLPVTILPLLNLTLAEHPAPSAEAKPPVVTPADAEAPVEAKMPAVRKRIRRRSADRAPT